MLLVAAAASLQPMGTRVAEGYGRESRQQAMDLTLAVDSRWCGGGAGGYAPVRVRATNVGRRRALTFRVTDGGAGESFPTVERRVLIEQNATQQFTLPVPLTGTSNYITFQVWENGQKLDPFDFSTDLPESRAYTHQRPSLLVIDPHLVDLAAFENAANWMAVGGGVAGPGHSVPGGPGARYEDSIRLAPELLPESWIDYSGLDVVAVPLATWESLPSAVRDAVLAWVETGGTLVFYQVKEPPWQSKSLERSLGLGNRKALGPHNSTDARPRADSTTGWWQFANPTEFQNVVVPPHMLPGGAPAGPEPKGPEGWSSMRDAFQYVDVMFGRVYALKGDPFPGNASFWTWWLRSLGEQSKWPVRMGLNSRRDDPEFFEFLIPGVGGVPVLSFLVLMTAFTIVIGPVNYFVLNRRRQLYLLVLTIPVIALLTTGALFAYTTVADGFGLRSRLRSFTLLDQQTKHAVSLNRISLYAGLAPRGGLKFSSDTAVLPLWSEDPAAGNAQVDWTDGQHLSSGWIKSRTEAQFLTIEQRVERGRLDVREPAAGKSMEVANGFEHTLALLIVHGLDGRVHAGSSIRAGGTAELHVATPADLAAFPARFNDSPLELPPNFSPPTSVRAHRYMMYGGASPPAVGFKDSQLETALRLMKPGLGHAAALPTGVYLAVFDENPGIELGASHSTPQGDLCVLMGYY